MKAFFTLLLIGAILVPVGGQRSSSKSKIEIVYVPLDENRWYIHIYTTDPRALICEDMLKLSTKEATYGEPLEIRCDFKKK